MDENESQGSGLTQCGWKAQPTMCSRVLPALPGKDPSQSRRHDANVPTAADTRPRLWRSPRPDAGPNRV